jgi:hypothetical protein
MSSLVFAKNIRWFFMRFFSERQIRLWFEKKSGGEPEIFQYKADISSCEKIVIFLPAEQDKFFVLLPFALSLSVKRMPDNFLVIADENNRPILRALDLERASLFYNSQTMLYGTADFFEIEKRIQERKWELCLFLQEKATLPFLYLARTTGAPYRMGVKQDFPFLNITLKNASFSDDIYANRNFLYKTFLIDSKKAEKDGIHATQKNEKLNSTSRLSTANTILLNLEPPINGEPLAESELFAIYKAFQPGWRLITIAATTSQLELYSKVMEELDMRSNHVLLHSESIFSVLRQYPGIITLNSLHNHLFLNLSNIKVLMLEHEQDQSYMVPNNQRMVKFSRTGNFYSLAKLASDFLRESK